MSFELGEAFVKVKGDTGELESDVSSGARIAGAAGGAIIAAALTKGIVDNLNLEAGLDRVSASLGLSVEESARIGTMAGDTYSGAWGDSLGEVQTMYGETFRAFPGISDAALQQVTEGAATTADVFDQDFNEVVRAAQALLINGLAPDAETAMNMVAGSLRDTAGPADEVLAAMSEYSPMFDAVGLDGQHMTNLLTSEFATTQFAIDKAGDAVKELALRATDGSESTAEALGTMGLSVEEVNAAYAEGGDAATNMTERIIGGLDSMEDPIARNAAGVALMGTPYEDLGSQAMPILNDMVNGQTDFNGAIDQMDATAYDNAATKMESFKRRGMAAFQGFIGNLLGVVIPALEGFAGVVTRNMGVVKVLAGIITAVFLPALIALGIQATISAAKQVAAWVMTSVQASIAAVKATAAMVVQGAKWVWLGVQAMASAVRIAAAWLISLGPIGLVIAAVVGLAVLIVANLDRIKGWISAAWNFIKGVTSAVWGAIKSFFSATWKAITGAVSSAVNSVKSTITSVFNAIKGFITTVLAAYKAIIVGTWNAIKSVVTSVVNGVKGAVTNAFNAIKSAVTNAVNGAKSAATSAFNAIKSAVSNAIGNALSTVRGFPGKVRSALSNLGTLLVGAGKALIRGLVNGIKKMASAPVDAVKNMVSNVRNLLPFSPAKEGPFSGKGYTLYSGQAIAGDLAKGITKNSGMVKSAVGDLMGEAQGGLNANLAVAGSGRSRGGDTYTIENVTIDASSLDEVRTIQEFFNSVQQTARAGRARR